jgi:hypothetical protein
MKIYVLVFSCCVRVGVLFGQSPQETVNRFFEAFHGQDTTAIREVIHHQISLQSVSLRSGRLVTEREHVNDFLRSIKEIPDSVSFLEELGELTVHEEEWLAHVWVPYSFSVNGQFSHRGTNSFVLVKDDEGNWKIIHLMDTRRR